MRETCTVIEKGLLNGSGVVRRNSDGRRMGMVVCTGMHASRHRGVIRGEGDGDRRIKSVTSVRKRVTWPSIWRIL